MKHDKHLIKAGVVLLAVLMTAGAAGCSANKGGTAAADETSAEAASTAETATVQTATQTASKALSEGDITVNETIENSAGGAFDKPGEGGGHGDGAPPAKPD